MRTRSLLAAALVAAAVSTPAQAGPPSDAQYLAVGCYMVVLNESTQLLMEPDTFTGIAVGVAIGFAPTLAHNPVSPTISYQVKVNGALATNPTQSLLAGPVVGLTLGQVTFSEQNFETDTYEVCTNVTTVDGHQQTIVWPQTCDPAGKATIPAQVLIDQLSPLCALPGGPVICSFIEALKIRLIENLPPN